MNLEFDPTSIITGVLETGALIFMALYIVFAVIVVKQIKIMTETLVVNYEKQLVYLAYAHLFFAILALLIGLALL
ncbi:hypothetical protein IPM62_00510 [Candidatus Woesebacteria bacterium]|nr:MAG: hypothetical protein IPM62_00510 [Candidatus Woesebacteria bacterium]